MNSSTQTNSSAATTTVKALEMSQTWRLNNFDKALELSFPADRLVGFPMEQNEMPGVRWTLQVYPNGQRFACRGNVSIFMNMVSADESREVVAKFKLWLRQDLPNSETITMVRNVGLHRFKQPYPHNTYGAARLQQNVFRDHLNSDGSVVLLVQLTVLVDEFSEINPVRSGHWSPSLTSPSGRGMAPEEFTKERSSRLLSTGWLSDFAVIVGDEIIPVHKCVLGMTSPVFRALFEGDNFAECSQNALTMTDSSKEAVDIFLNFLYTGGLNLPSNELNEATVALLVETLQLADQYQVSHLQDVCESRLRQVVTVENVLQLFVVAERHNCAALKLTVLETIVSKRREVIDSQEWKEFLQETPKQLNDLFLNLCSQLSSMKQFQSEE